MKILVTPAEYAEKLIWAVGKENFVAGVAMAMRQFPEMPEGYWSEVLEASTKL